MAKRKDCVDRRTHQVITDLKHYTLQRQLLEEVGITDYIDPLQEYMFLATCLVKIAKQWMSHTPPLSIENQKNGGCAITP